jgi:hypothetical protein
MRAITLVAVGVVSAVLGAAALASAADSQLPTTWHVHDCTSSCVLPHAAVGFFPRILGESLSTYLEDPAACPDATDKAFLGGGQPPTTDGVEPNQPLREGICMTSTTIIHLKSISPDQPAPNGWSYLSTTGGYATYYARTSR